MDLGQTLRDVRKAKKLSQASLADLAGTKQSTVSALENGTANVELSTLRSICAALDAEIVVVPRRVSGTVDGVIQQHLHRDQTSSHQPVKSVRDELFIPDDDDDDQGATR
jgi:transcriptional regulator with XRE-family HTH domain